MNEFEQAKDLITRINSSHYRDKVWEHFGQITEEQARVSQDNQVKQPLDIVASNIDLLNNTNLQDREPLCKNIAKNLRYLYMMGKRTAAHEGRDPRHLVEVPDDDDMMQVQVHDDDEAALKPQSQAWLQTSMVHA